MSAARVHFKFWLALSIATSIPSACGDSGPKTGTNTNWLKACDNDEDCGPVDSCLCGICTTTCESAKDCRESNSTCSKALTSEVQCSESDAPSVCLAACERDSNCTRGQVCLSNQCVKVDSVSACTGKKSELACSTFDDSSFDGWVPAVDANATLDVVKSPVFSGTSSLRSRWPGRAIVERQFDPILDGNLYGRFWLRLEATDSRAHVAQLDGDNGQPAFRLVVDGTHAWVESTNGTVNGKSVNVSAAMWHCVRFAIGLSDTQGTLQVWFDGSNMVDLSSQDTLPDAGVTGFQVGVGWADGDMTLYVDNALLSTSPVNCVD
jgi:hypothetical protein